MTRPEQKAGEERAASYVFEALGLAHRITGSGEPPDVIVECPIGRVGVEVTRYHRAKGPGLARQEVEAAWKLLLARVGVMAADHPAIRQHDVILGFREVKVPPKGQWDAVILGILAFLAKNAERIGSAYRKLEVDKSDAALGRYLGWIDARRSKSGYWDWNQSVFSYGYDPRQLLRVASPKLTTPRATGLDQYWLVVAGGIEGSQAIGLMDIDDLKSHAVLNDRLHESSFDAAFILDVDGSYAWFRGKGWRPLPAPDAY